MTNTSKGLPHSLSIRWLRAAISGLALISGIFGAAYQGAAYSAQDIGSAILAAYPDSKKAELVACSTAETASSEEVKRAVNLLFSTIRERRYFYVSAALLQCLGGQLQPADAETAYRIALMHRRGDRDFQRYEWLKRAADGGNLDALYLLASAGIGEKQHDASTAREMMLAAAKRGHRAAQLMLARYYTGFLGSTSRLGLPIDGYQAIYWYSQFLLPTPAVAYSCGDFPFHYQDVCSMEGNDLASIKAEIGSVYSRGIGGVPQDYHMARIWWDLAVADGSLRGGYAIYNMHIAGNGPKLTPEEVEKYKQLYDRFIKVWVVE